MTNGHRIVVIQSAAQHPPNTNPARYQPPDNLLAFLDQL